jgi:hypothetical protein
MENVNIYNDNVFDIRSAEDLQNFDQIFLLANSDENIKFRLGHDFFSLNKKNGQILQYPDYKSLYENINNKLIYENGNDIDNNFASIIDAAVNNLNLENFKHFDLENKKEFIVDKNEKGIAVHFDTKKSKIIESNIKNLYAKDSTLNTPELKDVKEVFDAFISLVSLLFILKLNRKNNSSKENDDIIKLVIDQLNQGQIDIKDVEKIKELDAVPGLREALKNYKEYFKEFSANLDLTQDNKIVVNENNLLLLGNGMDRIEQLLLESGSPVFLLDNPKDINSLENLIPENTETMSFVKNFILDDQIINYNNYSSTEIASASMLAGLKLDISLNKFDAKDNFFTETINFVSEKNLDMVKIANLSEDMVKNMTKFILIEEDKDLNKGMKI